MPPKSKRGKQKAGVRRTTKAKTVRRGPQSGGLRKGGTMFRPTALFSPSKATQNPKMSYGTDGSVRVRHSEMVADTVTTTANTFQEVHGYYINPGNQVLFSWLHTIASRYEMYQFQNLTFEYKTTTTTSATGTITFAIDYDANDDVPTCREDLFNFAGSKYSVPWADFSIAADRKTMSSFVPWRYVSNISGVSSGETRRENNSGYFYGFAQGLGANTVAGTLFVHYDVILKVPQMSKHLDAGRNSSYVSSVPGSLITPFATVTGASSTSFGLAPGTSAQLTFAVPGEYVVGLTFTGTVLLSAGQHNCLAVGANSTLIIDQSTLINTAATTGYMRFRLKIPVGTANPALTPSGFSLNSTGSATTVTNIAVDVSPWPYDVSS